jgi:polysaccharide export outer membrane protein
MSKLLTILLLSSIAFAQTSRPAPNVAGDALIPNLPAQVIGADDMIMVSVYNSPEFTRTVRVGPDGMIRLPMLKQKVKAAGLLPADLELTTAKALQDEELLVDPFVTVTILEYHSRPISVVGAVKKPVTFQAVGQVTLIEALTRAEGIMEDAEGEILISRPGPDQKTSLIQRIPMKSLIDGTDPDLNVKLIGGEEIRVPPAQRVTVTGNGVKKPGSFPVKDESEMSVMKAIALAEGTTQFFGNFAYIYRPDESKGGKNEIVVPLRKIMDRKEKDVPLLARDILYIPDSGTKKSMDKFLGIAGTTVSGLLIWH